VVKNSLYLNIVTYLLKARTVEPDKQSLLENGSKTTLVSRQRPWNRMEQCQLLGSRFLISNNCPATIEQPTEEHCFLCGPCWDIMTGTFWGNQSVARMLSWKRAAIQRGSESGSRGIAIVRSRYQKMIRGDCNGLRTLIRVIVICKVWGSAMVL
jgi:hypothetical protein